jgi:hypothetical protein
MNTHNQDETVVLEVFNDMGAAVSAQSKLAEQEIYSSIHDENVLGMDPVAGIELKVFAKDLEKARQVISELADS